MTLVSSQSWALACLLLFAEAIVCSVILARLAIPAGLRLGFVSRPGGRHQHQGPMPTLGGAAIVCGLLCTIGVNLTAAWLARDYLMERFPELGRYLPNLPSVGGKLGAVLGGAFVMFILGLADDRKHLGPKLKLFIMVLATVPLWLAGIEIGGFLPQGWPRAVATVVWVVFLTNSFNFLDNMDGLSGGVAMVAALGFGLSCFFAEEWFLACLFFAFAGSLKGFLIFNFQPARLFMGDNGSLFIGYMLGALSILATYYGVGEPGARELPPTPFPVLTPLMILAVPVFDTVSVLWIRLRTGRPLMEGDRNHLSHRLTDLGMSQRGAVIFIYVMAGCFGLAALPLRSVNAIGALAILAQTTLLFWIIHSIERTAQERRR